MALDAELIIVDAQVVDVSTGTSQLSTSVGTDKLATGRTGIPDKTHFIVTIDAVTAAAAGANVIPVQFVLQASLDGGSTYFDVATITLTLAASLAKTGIWATALGLHDFRDEVRATTDLVFRVKVTYTDNAETDDFTYSAYLGGPCPYPSNDVAVA